MMLVKHTACTYGNQLMQHQKVDVNSTLSKSGALYHVSEINLLSESLTAIKWHYYDEILYFPYVLVTCK